MEFLTHLLQGFSVLVIVWGTVVQFIKFLGLTFRSKQVEDLPSAITQVKTILGSYLLLGLEILISADIIESIVDPTIDHIIVLAVIVIIRTIISYFLTREINLISDKHSPKNT